MVNAPTMAMRCVGVPGGIAAGSAAAWAMRSPTWKINGRLGALPPNPRPDRNAAEAAGSSGMRFAKSFCRAVQCGWPLREILQFLVASAQHSLR
jgi:hypothetical protein